MREATGERRRFGRYETLFRIASGGMAEVYAARALGEAGFQKLVALKRMRPELAEDARFVTMFLDEGRVAANITSPNVVSTLDLGRAEDNSLYLVMELVVGVSLAVLAQETLQMGERVPVPLAVAILAQAANGLHDAHEATSPTGEPLGIVHRDCSPHNVIVDVHGVVKITDFGIAKALERQTQSHAGEMKGKLSYLSPEQARGRPVDRRSDIFILGIDAWELLTHRQLFEAASPLEALSKVANMAIPRPDEVDPRVPGAVADAVMQALERDPDQRFATAAAFNNALIHALGGRLPPRAEIGAFVRAHGGPALLHVENGIREAHGGTARAAAPSARPPPMHAAPSQPPPPAPETEPQLEAPVPLAVRRSAAPEPEPARERLRTQPLPLITPKPPAQPAKRASVRTEVLHTAEDELDRPSSIEAPHRRGSGGRIAAIILLVALAVTGGLFGAWAFEHRSASAPPPPVASPGPAAPSPEPDQDPLPQDRLPQDRLPQDRLPQDLPPQDRPPQDQLQATAEPRVEAPSPPSRETPRVAPPRPPRPPRPELVPGQPSIPTVRDEGTPGGLRSESMSDIQRAIEEARRRERQKQPPR